MQPQRAENNEISSLSNRLVAARGANAAQRARHFHVESAADFADEVPGVESDSSQPAQTVAESPLARRRGDQVAKPPASTKSGSKPASRRGRRRLALIGAAAVVTLGALGWFGYHYVTVGRYLVSTDDAYVRADATTLAAKVSGYVASVDVADNMLVHAGDVIARIDDGDYRLAAQAARDKVATQQATVGRIGQQIVAQQAAVVQARAQLASARAVATRTESELKRQQALSAKAFASRQTLEQAQSSNAQAMAAVKSAQAVVASAIANVGVLEAQQQEAERQLTELKTAQAKAERDLSFTVIRAPVDGVIGNRAMQVGDLVQPGQRLAALVPLDDVYIDANFKETQVSGLRPGQAVKVSVDALPDRDITGTVASMSPASGSVFSLLPPDNATGNFTKIVQRLAVRIRLPAAVTDKRLLRPGMSVVVSVNTKPNAAVAANSSWFAHATTGAAQSKLARW
ncbi:MAG TPA: HlyD family secretion protein [Pseudolabrys sp.]|nr:HlyD family secretion protein [Pseudolabrys sp.]